jgi:hypothetical protein
MRNTQWFGREHTLKDIPYGITVGSTKGAYNDLLGGLVLLRGASLPDVCVVCGSPARGNVYHKEFEPYWHPSWEVPFFWQIVYSIVGKRYLLDFPFCLTCKPDEFQIDVRRINNNFAIFAGASRTLLKSLPLIPLNLAAEMEGTRLERVFRWFAS